MTPAALIPSQNTKPPPDASSVTPEMKLASSDSSHRMALAISWAWPTRPMAIVASMPARKSPSASVSFGHLGLTMPGRSEIDADALVRHLLGKAHGEGIDRGLARGIGRRAGPAADGARPSTRR